MQLGLSTEKRDLHLGCRQINHLTFCYAIFIDTENPNKSALSPALGLLVHSNPKDLSALSSSTSEEIHFD